MSEQNHPDFLIIGATGLVGEAIGKAIPKGLTWLGTCFNKRPDPSFYQLDIRNKNAAAELIDKLNPKHVILSTNLSGGVFYAEKHPEEARTLHYQATIDTAAVCRNHGAKLIFISSECVFDGKKEHYTENDPLSPLSVYGKCKADCESWLHEHMDNFAIARTMSVFGWQPETNAPNAIMSTYFALQKGQDIRVPDFRWGTPTYVKDLAAAIVELCVKDANGTYQVSGSTYLSRYDWIKQSCRALGWDETKIKAQTEVPSEAKIYPLKIQLDNNKFRSEFKVPLHTLEESLELLKKDIKP